MTPPNTYTLTEKIPDHLTPFVSTQDPSLYTPMDHSSWRYIMKISAAFFKDHAHEKYQAGLKLTGISTDRIPLISEMDSCLRKFGWRAVGVVGFIPPNAFMEFQSLGILPIACDMRQIEHLAYTPAPDIVHEAAGHAPIIADPAYARFLRSGAELNRKAIVSKKDMEMYHAIRLLSDTKEDPNSTPEDIARAQKALEQAVAAVEYVSEATHLARIFWWTVEYGLVGTLQNPVIYGAGLLSSVGESYNCLSAKVRKIPLTLDCINVPYDITRPQPQLFVVRDLADLAPLLEDYSETMAYKKGGLEGLAKAKMSESVTTTVLDSGIQIGGILTDIRVDQDGAPAFLKYAGPCQLGLNDRELPGHGGDTHKDGFSAPVGLLKGTHHSAAEMSEADLKKGVLEFESGVKLKGTYKGRVTHTVDSVVRNAVIAYENCTITWGDEVLYKPEWGTFDLACGSAVTSVFGGAPDRAKYMVYTGELDYKALPPKSNLTPDNRALNDLYKRVRDLREKGKTSDGVSALGEIASNWVQPGRFGGDWLLGYELLELNSSWKLNAAWTEAVTARLDDVAKADATKAELLQRGLRLLN